MSFLDICMHPRHTEPVDGQSICSDCGATLEPVLTHRMFERTFELIRRDYGYGRHHSMRCVDTPDGWCCATDCTMRG